MSRHLQVQKKKSMPTIHKVLIALIGVALIALAAVIIFGISNLDNLPGGPGPGHIDIDPDDPAMIIDPNEDDERPRRPDPSPRPRPELDTGVEHYNPLTGEAMDLGKSRARPIAVVLNNLAEALPLNGVSKADIIYEYPVEGGLTRTLALFQDVSDVQKVGSIRSARHYTVQIAHAYDAILVAAGRSPQAQEEVRTLNVPFLNEVEGPLRDALFRDRNRVPGRRVENLHAVVTTGERLMLWLPEYSFRLMHEDNYEQSLSFTADAVPQNGSTANEATIRYSGARSTTFSYNQAQNAYTVRYGNNDFIDANDNSRPSFTNILVLKTSVSLIPGDNSGRLNVNTTGSGTGYFINGGKYIEINWTRANQSVPFTYTLSNGTPFDFGVGKTYICIVPTNQDTTFS